MQKHHRFAFPLTTLAAALLAAFGPARAEEADEVKLLIKPDSELSVGLGYVDNENQRWGKYTGMTDNGAYGLLDFNIVNPDDETGTWVRVLGRNLGLAALSSGIFGSTFFMLTGFHGFHVFVGMLMLFFITLRLQKGHFTADRHFGFEGAAWYWHFVDVVWLGLFVFVYWL